MTDTEKLQILRREAFHYLDAIHTTALHCPPDAWEVTGIMCLNLGKHFTWTASVWGDPPGAEIDPVGHYPRSILSLGKQLTSVGNQNLDRAKQHSRRPITPDRLVDPHISALMLHVHRLEERIARLDGALGAASLSNLKEAIKEGGAK